MILLNDDYRISSDPRNWFFQKRRLAKKGEFAGQYVWDTLSYHRTIKNVLEKYRDVAFKDRLEAHTDEQIDNWIQYIGERDEAFKTDLMAILREQEIIDDENDIESGKKEDWQINY